MKTGILFAILLLCTGDSLGHNDSLRYWTKSRKGVLAFKLTVPEVNFIYLNKGYGYGESAGFLGISGGFEYYIGQRFYLNGDIGTMTDFLLPFPAPVDYWGSYNRAFANYGDIQVGYDWKRAHFDIGIQCNRTRYFERETVELFPNYIDTLKYHFRQFQFGPAFSSYFRIARLLFVSANYYPSWFVVSSGKTSIRYGYLIFFEIGLRFEANRQYIKD